jgi:hypothetical protein
LTRGDHSDTYASGVSGGRGFFETLDESWLYQRILVHGENVSEGCMTRSGKAHAPVQGGSNSYIFVEAQDGAALRFQLSIDFLIGSGAAIVHHNDIRALLKQCRAVLNNIVLRIERTYDRHRPGTFAVHHAPSP